MIARSICQRVKGFPPVTLLLILSCCAISIPLLLRPKLYEVLGCDNDVRQFVWQFLTSQFAHGTPGNSAIAPLPHFLSNALVIALFGLVIERALGSGRFFLLTLATFTTHAVWKTTIGGGNGASGFCWGYTVFIVPILFWEWRQRRKQVFRDPLYLSLAALAAFMVFGVAAVLWARGLGLWNGSNQAHVYSILTALPFAFLWHNVIRENWRRLGEGEAIDRGYPPLRAAALGTCAFVLVFNLVVAGLAVSGRVARPAIEVAVTPANGDIAVLNTHHQRVAIVFNLPMAEHVDAGHSITWHDEKGPLGYEYRWVDAKTVVVCFSREVYQGESIYLDFYVKDAGGWDKERVEIRFPLEAE